MHRQASQSGERFIHISPSEVMVGADREDGEDHPLNPMSPYASAKFGARRWSTPIGYLQYPAVIVRPLTTPDHNSTLKRGAAVSYQLFLREPLTVHGDGSRARDWIFCRRAL